MNDYDDLLQLYPKENRGRGVSLHSSSMMGMQEKLKLTEIFDISSVANSWKIFYLLVVFLLVSVSFL